MIGLVTTAEAKRVQLLDQFINHYTRLGVSRFEISIQFEPNTSFAYRAEIMEVAEKSVYRKKGVTLRALVCEFDAMALRTHHDSIQSEMVQKCEWILWPDIDELQIYPKSLLHLISIWKAKGINVCRGYFVDRITRNGSLTIFDPNTPIWSQYPVGTNLTKVLVQGQTNKVVCARSTIRIKHANHDPIRGQDLIWASESVPVHHFKWDASLSKRLQIRLTPSWKARCPWWPQTERVVTAIDRNAGRLPLSGLHLFDFEDDLMVSDWFPFEKNPRYLKSFHIAPSVYLNR